MQRFDGLLKIFGRMTLYGLILGAIAGFLVGVVILLGEGGMSEFIDSIIGVIFLSVIYGGSFGALFGGAAGLFSGVVMAFVTALAFREIRNPKRYKLVMGSVTGILTVGVFIYGGLWQMGGDMGSTWLSAMFMSTIIAVYASQITARKHINETSTLKQKAKA